MDVNQTRFHLVYGKADWYPDPEPVSPSAEPLFDWNSDDATLSLHKNLFVFPKSPAQPPLDVANRRGADRDRYGNWYWIAPSKQEIRFRGTVQKNSEHYWAAGDQQSSCAIKGQFFDAIPAQASPLSFSGLAVTPEHYLVVGIVSPPGLLVFDLYAGGPPKTLLWPVEVPFQPFDMSVSPDGGIFILDRDNKLYWKLDRELRVESIQPVGPNPGSAEIFQPVGGGRPTQFTCESFHISLAFAAPLSGISDVVAIAALPDGSVVVLENPPGSYFSIVHRYVAGVEVGPAVRLDKALALYVPDPPNSQNAHSQAIRAYDFAFVGASTAPETGATLYLAEISGNQSFAADLTVHGDTFSLNLKPQYFPMRQFAGKGLVVRHSSVYYDFQDGWVPLVEQPQQEYQTQAQLLLPKQTTAGPSGFDSKLPQCAWHRLFLDACIPHGASIQIESRAADAPALLPDTPWQLEPTAYLRGDGPEIPYLRAQLQGKPDRTGTWELLFQQPRGRYLQLRLTLRGSGRNTPRIHALRVYYPRFSYLHEYLPAVYRDDAVSASFLDRFLANMEGFYTVLEGKIADVQELFDSRLVPAEYLDWLASWLSFDLDPSWSERTRRLVIPRALQMFRERGTANGIVRAIRLMTEPCPDESLFDESSCSLRSCPSLSSNKAIFSVRLVEKFLTRIPPGLPLDTATSVTGPDSVSATSETSWTPAQGSEPLNVRFRCYLQTQYATINALNQAWSTNFSNFDDPSLALPASQPTQSMQAQDWKRFLRDAIGFTYVPVSSSDLSSYQVFLTQRYATITALNSAYSLTGTNAWTSFSSITLPSTLPSGGLQLQDWILFVAVALPIQRNAHRFTVLIPVSLMDTPEAQETRLAVAQYVTNIEKPAHTSFDVQLYWALFRAGEARLGLDTLLGPGSRFTGLILGRGYLSGGNLAPVEPILAKDRKRLGPRPIDLRCRELRSQEKCP